MRTNSARPIRSPAGSRRAAGPTNRFARAAACLVAAAGLCAAIGSARAATDDDERLAHAESVLAEFAADELRGIPIDLLRRAHGIAVIPGVIRGGFLLGARRGRGVLTVRTAGGRFANPAFITLTGGSIGGQIGVESADVVLVFANERAVRNIEDGKFTLGGDVSTVAGPTGRHTTAALTGRAEVYAYIRSRGLFAGAAFEGARLDVDEQGTARFYAAADGAEAFEAPTAATPPSARRFLAALERAAAPPRPPGARSSGGGGGEAPADEARTFPLEGAR